MNTLLVETSLGDMESSQVEAENDVGPVESTISEAGGALHITEKESGIQVSSTLIFCKLAVRYPTP